MRIRWDRVLPLAGVVAFWVAVVPAGLWLAYR